MGITAGFVAVTRKLLMMERNPLGPTHSVQDPHNFSDDRETEWQAEATFFASTFIPLRNAEWCDKRSVLLEAQRSQDRRLSRTTVLVC